nr:hypothetical protein [Escherichia coli]
MIQIECLLPFFLCVIFDNDEDRTDSAALLPCIEQAREDIRILRQLQLLQQNR